MRTLRRYFRLSRFERRIAVQCCLGLVFTWAGLRLAGFRVWKNAVAALTPRVRADRDAGRLVSVCNDIVRIQAAVERLLPFKVNCLDHALVLCWMLRRHGVPANIQIGGRKERGCFEAHAWVEVGGIPVGDEGSAHRQFAPFGGPVGVMKSQTR